MPRLLRLCFKTRWSGRGAGTPAPQLRLAPAKFGAGKFYRLAQKKNKKSKGRKVFTYMLSVSSAFVNN